MKHMIANPIVLIVSDDHFPHAIPQNVRVAKSVKEAEFLGVLSRGEKYVAFRKYLGLTSTGSSPWVVILNQDNHQVVQSTFPSLKMAIEAVAENNTGDSFAFKTPKSSDGTRLFEPVES